MPIYDNSQNLIAPLINFTKKPTDGVSPTSYTINGQEVTEKDYNNFITGLSTKTKILKLDDSMRNDVSSALAEQANNLGLRGAEFSDYVENHVLPSTGAKSDNAVNSLTPPIDDKQITAESTPSQSYNLVGVIKDGMENQAQIMVNLVDGLDHLTSLIQNSNQIKKEQNEIAIKGNENFEIMANAMMSQNAILVETLTAIGQSLAFIPKIVETLSIASDRQIEAMNTTNEHLLQKNANDTDYYNDSMNNDNGTARNLSMINANIGTLAQTHAEIATHQEKQAHDAENNIKDWEDENSSIFDDIMNTAVDLLHDARGAVVDQLDDVDIFTYFINETKMTEEDIKNGY